MTSLSSVDILAFLREAQAVGWPANIRPRTDHEFTGFEQTSFERAPWRYLDIWSGATTDIGLQTIFHHNRAVWGCTYRGGITDERFMSPDDNPVFKILVAALQREDRATLPIRGPRRHREGDWSYSFESSGDPNSFIAVEHITLHGAGVYERVFIGGRQGDGVCYGRPLQELASMSGVE